MLHIALKQAIRSEVRCKHGAAISRGGRCLGQGHNTYRSHPKWGASKIHSKSGREFFTIHAEAAAIRNAVRQGIDPRGSVMYVTRAGHDRMSRPCASCQLLLKKYGIRKVVYTNSVGEICSEWPL